MKSIPNTLSSAIINGTWRDPGSDSLREFLKADLPDMELFEDEAVMKRVTSQLETAGYVDDPQFCFVRESTGDLVSNDARLVFERVLIVGGSKIPGDDVFIAVRLDEHSAPEVLVFDWDRSIPNRWVVQGTLVDLIQKLERLKVNPASQP